MPGGNKKSNVVKPAVKTAGLFKYVWLLPSSLKRFKMVKNLEPKPVGGNMVKNRQKLVAGNMMRNLKTENGSKSVNKGEQTSQQTVLSLVLQLASSWY